MQSNQPVSRTDISQKALSQSDYVAALQGYECLTALTAVAVSGELRVLDRAKTSDI